MKFLSSIIYSAGIAFLALFQTIIEPNPIWAAMFFGSVCGGLGRVAFDVSKNGKRNLSKVIFESLGLMVLITACGLFLMEIVLYYFQIRQQIEAGTMDKRLPIYLSAFLSCLITFGGRTGLEFATGIVKTLITQWAGTKKENE